MAFVGQPYRINYIARGFESGLLDVRMVVYKPNGVKQGVYTLSELNGGDGKGIYFYNYEDSDLVGTYLFVIDCPSHPKKDARQVFFSDVEAYGWTESEKNQIRDALGISGNKDTAIGGQLQAVSSKVDAVRADVQFIKDIEGGKWELVPPNLLIMYRADNVTEVARWHCFNESGLPTIENIVMCERA